MFWLLGFLVPVAGFWFLSRLFVSRRPPFVKQLSSLLTGCVAEGVISEDQMHQIVKVHERQRQGLQLRGTTWIGIFAGLFVATGVSLLIAHNWDQIGPLVRVGTFTLLLAVLGESVARLEERKPLWALPLSLLWFFFPILGIGLYAQTFQLSGDPVRPFLVWAALLLPLIWVSRKAPLTILHLILLCGVLFAGSFIPENQFAIVASRYRGDPPTSAIPWIVALILFAVATAESFRLLPSPHRKHVLGMGLLWLTLLLFLPTSLKLGNGGWLFAAATAASSLWLALHLWMRSSMAERVPSYLAVVGCLYAMTFVWHMNSSFSGGSSKYGIALVVTMALGAFAIFLLSPRDIFSPVLAWNRLFQVLFLVPLLLSFLLPHLDATGLKVVAVAANVLLFSGALAAMWHGSMTGSNLRINLGVAVLLLLMITRFVDVFGDFVLSGVGFIGSGALLGVVAYALDKARKHLIQRGGAVP